MENYIEINLVDKCDFIQKISKTLPDTNFDFYSECKQERIKEYEMIFLVSNEEMHKQILMTIGLENLCENPYFSNLRQNMKDLVLLLAAVASSVPNFKHYGFYCGNTEHSNEIHNQSLPQEIARHCQSCFTDCRRIGLECNRFLSERTIYLG